MLLSTYVGMSRHCWSNDRGSDKVRVLQLCRTRTRSSIDSQATNTQRNRKVRPQSPAQVWTGLNIGRLHQMTLSSQMWTWHAGGHRRCGALIRNLSTSTKRWSHRLGHVGGTCMTTGSAPTSLVSVAQGHMYRSSNLVAQRVLVQNRHKADTD